MKNLLIKENPILVYMIGLCPALIVSTHAINALSLGVVTIIVLLLSNILISILKNAIPGEMRIPIFAVIIAGFTTLVAMIVQAFAFPLYMTVGLSLFLPILFAVNCIVLARAEVVASKSSVGASIADAIGIGLGFTVILFIVASIREILGQGTFFGAEILPAAFTVGFPGAAGGLVVLAFVIALINKITGGKKEEAND